MKREIALCDKILGIFQLQFSKKKARQTYTTMSQLAFLVFVKITCHFYGGGKLKKQVCTFLHGWMFQSMKKTLCSCS